MIASRNERRKLVANALDRLSTACFTVGILAPTAASLYNAVVLADSGVVLFTIAVYFVSAFVLHGVALRILQGIE